MFQTGKRSKRFQTIKNCVREKVAFTKNVGTYQARYQVCTCPENQSREAPNVSKLMVGARYWIENIFRLYERERSWGFIEPLSGVSEAGSAPARPPLAGSGSTLGEKSPP